MTLSSEQRALILQLFHNIKRDWRKNWDFRRQEALQQAVLRVSNVIELIEELLNAPSVSTTGGHAPPPPLLKSSDSPTPQVLVHQGQQFDQIFSRELALLRPPPFSKETVSPARQSESRPNTAMSAVSAWSSSQGCSAGGDINLSLSSCAVREAPMSFASQNAAKRLEAKLRPRLALARALSAQKQIVSGPTPSSMTTLSSGSPAAYSQTPPPSQGKEMFDAAHLTRKSAAAEKYTSSDGARRLESAAPVVTHAPRKERNTTKSNPTMNPTITIPTPKQSTPAPLVGLPTATTTSSSAEAPAIFLDEEGGLSPLK